MNWEVAKNWLIASFLVLDLILGWQVFQSRRQLVGYVESYSDQLASTKTILAEHGLSLDITPPVAHPDLPFLHADYAAPQFSDVLGVAFPKVQSSYYVEPTGSFARSSLGTIKPVGKGSWVVHYDTPPSVEEDNVSGLLANVWNGSSYAYDVNDSTSQSTNNPTSMQATFHQMYNDYWVFDANLVAVLSGNKLLEYEQTALTNLHPAGDTKPTISALDALDNLANSVDKSGQHKDNKILSMRLGYTHKTTNATTTDPLPATNYWFPVWRVETAGQTYYINAFTGEVDTTS